MPVYRVLLLIDTEDTPRTAHDVYDALENTLDSAGYTYELISVVEDDSPPVFSSDA